MNPDQSTAGAFASSWNNLPEGSVYAKEQVAEWFQPLTANDIRGARVLEYSFWIAKRPFSFFRHVAFDQLVTPETVYLDRATIESWLKSNPRVVPESSYVTMRNGNSWKFGGHVR